MISGFDWVKLFFSHENRNKIGKTKKNVMVGFYEHFVSNSMQIINCLNI